MTEIQPLLKTDDSIFSHDDHNFKKNSLYTELLDWWRSLFLKKHHDDYEETNNMNNTGIKRPSVGFCQFFRFANRIDWLMSCIAIFAAASYGLCYTGQLFVSGKLMGTFALQSFSDFGHHQIQCNLPNMTSTNKSCPLGINFNLLNDTGLKKLCYSANATSASPLFMSMVEFQNDVMNKIYWLIAIAIIQFICLFTFNFLFNLTVRRQAVRMRVCLFETLVQQSMSYFDTNSSRQFNAALFDNIEKFITGISGDLGIAIATLVFSVSCAVTSVIIYWQLALILMCIVPLLIVSLYAFMMLTGKEAAVELNAYAKAGEIAQEVFSSLRTVLSLNGAHFEQNRYQQELHRTHWSSVRKGVVYGLFEGWNSFTLYMIYALGFLFGSILMHEEGRNKLNIGTIILVITLFTQGIYLIGMIGPCLQALAEAQVAIKEVFRLIDETNGTDDNETKVWQDSDNENTTVDFNGDICFDNVTFEYPTRHHTTVLQNLTFVARAGETTALVGSSGSGKSTCMSLLLRLYEPSSGNITINGKSIRDYNVKKLRQSIGVVNQEPILFDTTIYENILYGNKKATRSQIEEAAREANAHNFIMQLTEVCLFFIVYFCKARFSIERNIL
ncbi:unnamed protein product [Rotaria socialis]|uniref:ABC transmembrane type-1 domain-containing protein n=1 Tax=Rotaria socialis TaxID=392032 RepID=A0A821DC70_9BILA|nr:unnamed protein product [Rotaria socialis]